MDSQYLSGFWQHTTFPLQLSEINSRDSEWKYYFYVIFITSGPNIFPHRMNFELCEQDCNCKHYVVLILEWKQHGTALQFCFSDCRLLRPDFIMQAQKRCKAVRVSQNMWYFASRWCRGAKCIRTWSVICIANLLSGSHITGLITQKQLGQLQWHMTTMAQHLKNWLLQKIMLFSKWCSMSECAQTAS